MSEQATIVPLRRLPWAPYGKRAALAVQVNAGPHVGITYGIRLRDWRAAFGLRRIEGGMIDIEIRNDGFAQPVARLPPDIREDETT